MDPVVAHTGRALEAANEIYARSGGLGGGDNDKRPPVYKAIGISLAIGSGLFIGTSFVLKKVGLLRANEKYNEEAGEGYGYLKNFYWWSGMTLMIIGEICNFVAYAFTDAILVTPLGALSVVLTTILSAIFLKERLSMVGKVACFLCIVGSVVIVMNAPESSSVSTIQDMQKYVITPGFLSYAGVIIVGSAITAFYAGPRWGKKNMMVYISICSWVGGLSVVATQGLGAAVVAQAGGQQQFNQWFLYVLLVFVIATLLTEIIFLNKALNIFNAAMVTPTYYVYFTSTTIITSAVLFQGFKGTPTSIVTVVNGFLTICSGVVLLQLSKSAKDVPDTAVFTGDLDQIHTIAEQEQPETEPKADAIRGAAAIVRRFSVAREKMEAEELKRLHEEKMRERLEPVSEDGSVQYEWDGLRRRKTTMSSVHSASGPRAVTSPNPFNAPDPPKTPQTAPPQTAPGSSTPRHPPLGMSRFPTEEELEEERNRSVSPGVLSSFAGTIRGRTRSVLSQNRPDLGNAHGPGANAQSPMHPVPLTEISVPGQGNAPASVYGVPGGKTEYEGGRPSASNSNSNTNASGRRIQFSEVRHPSRGSANSSLAPTPPPHSAKRQFSFQNVFRKPQAPVGGDGADEELRLHQHHHHLPRPGFLSPRSRGYSNPQVRDETEEEQLGLVTGDSRSMPTLPRYDEEEGSPEEGEPFVDEDKKSRYGRDVTSSPPRGRSSGETEKSSEEEEQYEALRGRWEESKGSSPPPPPPPHGSKKSPPGGGRGVFI